jgi:WD40 repeat protein
MRSLYHVYRLRFSLILPLLFIQVVTVSAQDIDSFAEDIDWNEQTGQIALGYVTGELTVVDPTTLIETTVVSGLEHIVSIDWHPTIADRIAVANTAGEIFIVDTTTATVVLSFRAADYVAEIAWRPQGDYLAGSITYNPISPEESNGLEIWNATGVDRYPGTDSDLMTLEFDWSPDGNNLAYAIVRDSHAAIRIVDAVSGDYLATLDIDPELIGAVRNIAWSGNNELAATIDSTVIIWNTVDWSQIIRLDYDQNVGGVSWSPDSSYLAFRLGGREIRIVDANTFEVVSNIQGPNYFGDFEWNSSSQQIAYLGYEGTASTQVLEIADLAAFLP